MRERVSVALAVAAALAAAGCGGGGGVVTVAGVEPPLNGAGAAFHVPAGAVVLHAGPGPVRTAVGRHGYRVSIVVRPNRASRPNQVAVTVRRFGRAVPGAHVRLDAGMLDMGMGVATYRLGAGPKHTARLPVWGMPGRWGLGFTVAVPGEPPLRVVVADRLS
jgi:hypothetical protein